MSDKTEKMQKEPEHDGEKAQGERKGKEKTVSLTETEYQQLLEEAKAYKDKYVRLYAEFENARKRMERDRLDYIKYANEELIAELLYVIDHLELSVKAAQTNPGETKNLIKGVEMVLVNAKELLKKNGVVPIETEGKMFDPAAHEILAQEPSEKEEGTVLEEMQRGYKYHDRVLRTAKVKIAQRQENIQEETENG